MELNAEQTINELDTQLKYAQFTNSGGVLLSAKCAKFCLEHIQYYEQKIKELTEENERVKLEYAGFESGTKQIVRGLKSENEKMLEEVSRLKIALWDAQNDTVKKLRETVNKRLDKDTRVFTQQRYIVIDVINQIAKEMLEGEE